MTVGMDEALTVNKIPVEKVKGGTQGALPFIPYGNVTYKDQKKQK